MLRLRTHYKHLLIRLQSVQVNEKKAQALYTAYNTYEKKVNTPWRTLKSFIRGTECYKARRRLVKKVREVERLIIKPPIFTPSKTYVIAPKRPDNIINLPRNYNSPIKVTVYPNSVTVKPDAKVEKEDEPPPRYLIHAP